MFTLVCHRALVVALAMTVLSVSPAVAAPIDEARALQRSGAYEAALERYREVLAAPSADAVTRGIALNNSCVVLTDLGRLDDALGACSAALEMRTALGDERAIGRTLNNLARVHQQRGDLALAGEHFEAALVINRGRQDHAAVAVNLNNLAALAITAGRDDRALHWLAQAAALCDRFPDAPWTRSQRIFSVLNEGVVLERLGAFERALDRYEPLLDDAASLDRQRRADLAVNAATLYRNLGDPVRALERLDLAAEMYRALGAATGRATAQHNRGIVLHRNLGRPAESEAALRDALLAADEAGAEPLGHDIRLTLAAVLVARGAFGEAATLLQTVDDARHEPRWATVAGLAELAFAQGATDDAVRWVEEAIRGVESARARLGQGADRTHFLEAQRPVYELAVDVLASRAIETRDRADAERAFAVVQQAKARALTERLGTVGPPSFDTEALRARLGNRILVSFFVTRRGLYRWRIDRTGTDLRSLGPSAPWLEDARRAHEALRRDVFPAAEVVDRLRGLVDDFQGDDRPVLVSMDGALGRLPLALLLEASRPITYLPSASSLMRHRAKRSERRDRGLLAIGAPGVRSGPEPAPTRLLFDRFGLTPLSTPELSTIGEWVPGAVRLLAGSEATETAFVREAGAPADVLHVATHTVFDPRARRGGAIVLEADAHHDGLLHADEISALALDVDLTVLAACRSAVGAVDGGPADSSLAGAFLAAGSRAIVASLWDVGDHATATFMNQLYFHLGRGARPALALARTQASFRADRQWRDSSTWAAFVLIGDAPPLPQGGTGRRWFGLLLGLAVIAALLVGVVRWRREQSRQRDAGT